MKFLESIVFDEKIPFEGQYVHGKAKEVFTDFSESQLVVKSETGIGGTTSVLNYTGGNVILVVPLVSILESKMKPKEPYESQRQFFVYFSDEGIADDWKQVRQAFQEDVKNAIIICTPDNLVKAKDSFPDLYNDHLKKTPIFLDEFHTYIIDRNYRSKLGRISALIYNEWETSITMSTATPNYRLFDIPEYLQLKKKLVYPINRPKKPLKISGQYQDAKKFIMEECENGNKVAVFTNLANIHKHDFSPYKVRHLFGNSLERKAAKKGIRKADTEAEDFYDADIFIHSSAYFVGYDFRADASVCIISDQKNSAHTISLQNFIQAYGRCREQIINALFVNITSSIKLGIWDYKIAASQKELDVKVDKFVKKTSKVKGNVLEVLRAFPNLFKKEEYTIDHYYDLTVEGSKINEAVVNYQLFHSETVEEYLESRNFELSEYYSEYQIRKPKAKYNFRTTYLHYLQEDEHFLVGMYEDSKVNIRYGGDGANSWEESFEFLTGILLKELQPEILIKKLSTGVNKRDFHSYLYKFLRVNFPDLEYSYHLNGTQLENWRGIYQFNFQGSIDKKYLREWFIFYTMYQLKIFKNEPKNAEHLPRTIAREVAFYDTVSSSDIYEEHLEDRKNRNNLAEREIHTRLDDRNLSVQNDLEKLEVLKIKKEIFRHFDKKKGYKDKYSRDTLINTMRNVLIYLVNKGQGHFAQKQIDSRTYGPITNLPRRLRQIIPLKYVEVDVSYANAQFIDKLIRSDIAQDIYNNIMHHYNFSRDEAKVLYNYVLNAWYIHKNQIQEMLSSFGYNQEEVEKLSPMVSTKNSGDFFRKVTAKEKELIDDYMDYLNQIEAHRLHDCVVIPIWDAQRVKLPLKFKDYNFHVSFFNSNESYQGELTEVAEGEYAPIHLKSNDTYWGYPLC